MAVNDIYQLIVDQTLHGQRIVNVMHYKEIVTSANPVVELLSQFNADIVPLMKAVQSNELSHVRTVAQRIFPVPPLVPVENILAAGAGNVAQNSLPTSVAVTITKRTQFAGRKWRGRWFVCGVPITHEDNSQLAAANLGAWNALAAKLDDDLNFPGGASFDPILWNRVSKTSEPITLCLARTVLRNQRRRQIGRGE